MTKERRPSLEEEFESLLEELPPMDDDEPKEPSPEDLAREFESAIDMNEDEVFGDISGKLSEETPLESDFYDCDELIENTESVWIEEENDEVVEDFEVASDVEDQGWTEDWDEDGKPELILEDSWFQSEEDGEPVVNDDGAEGPIGTDAITLDAERKLWEDMSSISDEDGDDLDEELDAIAAFGIDLSDDEPEMGMRYSAGFVLDKQFLGPADGGVAAVCFSAGSPIAVGEGLFVIGADGLFHGIQGSHWLEKVSATSVCMFGDRIFLGTNGEGAFVSEDQGRSLTQINGWYTSGLASTETAALERFSTAFYLVGQEIEKGYRLYGRAGAGQLFASDDLGVTWRGPLVRGRCQAMACVSGTQDFIAVVELSKNKVALMKYNDVSGWENLEIPVSLAESLVQGNVSIAAHGNTVLVGADDVTLPLHETSDWGRTWTLTTGLKGVTALAMDPDDPSWVVAATDEPSRGASVIHFSEDGGQTWQAVAVLNDRLESTDDEQEIVLLDSVRALSVDVGKERRVMAVKGERVFLITLARPGVSH